MAPKKATVTPEQVPAPHYPTPLGHLLLIVVWLLPYFVTVPAHLNTIVSASVTVFVGCWRSVKEAGPTETMSTQEAIRFPIVGSAVLLTLFLTFKFLPKELVNLALTGYFGLLGVIAIIMVLYPFLEPQLPQRIREIGYHKFIKLPFLKEPIEIEFTLPEAIIAIPSLVISALYCYKRHWLANNLLAITFGVTGIEQLSLGNVKVGAILLMGLFFYDIFWVFCTPVMVTVAKSFDAPIKLVFPNGFDADTGKPLFSMLGLGDIVIPGIYVALLLRYDTYAHLHRHPYFASTMASYVLGMGLTIWVMLVFKAAQPALLYLVPAILCASFGVAAVRGEVSKLLAWSEEVVPAEGEEETTEKEDDKEDDKTTTAAAKKKTK